MSKSTDAREKLDRYIREVVDQAPPLTADQRGRIAMLLTIRTEAEADPPLSDVQRGRVRAILRSGTSDTPDSDSAIDEVLAR